MEVSCVSDRVGGAWTLNEEEDKADGGDGVADVDAGGREDTPIE